MAGILPIRRKTQNNQSINQTTITIRASIGILVFIVNRRKCFKRQKKNLNNGVIIYMTF